MILFLAVWVQYLGVWFGECCDFSLKIWFGGSCAGEMLLLGKFALNCGKFALNWGKFALN